MMMMMMDWKHNSPSEKKSFFSPPCLFWPEKRMFPLFSSLPPLCRRRRRVGSKEDKSAWKAKKGRQATSINKLNIYGLFPSSLIDVCKISKFKVWLPPNPENATRRPGRGLDLCRTINKQSINDAAYYTMGYSDLIRRNIRRLSTNNLSVPLLRRNLRRLSTNNLSVPPRNE